MAEPKDLEARFKELSERNAQLMAALEAKIATPTGGIDAATLEGILQRTTAAASKGSELIASKMKPENVDHLHKSCFEYPEGGLLKPKPPLFRETYFGAFQLRHDSLTPAEVEALNGLHASLARSQRRVTRDGKWVAEVNDADNRLTIRVPMKTMDDRADLPGLTQIAMELTGGVRAMDQNDLAQAYALLRKEMDELKGTAA